MQQWKKTNRRPEKVKSPTIVNFLCANIIDPNADDDAVEDDENKSDVREDDITHQFFCHLWNLPQISSHFVLDLPACLL